MDLKEKIKNDLNRSLKEREKLTSSTLRLLLATILNREKEKRAKIAKGEKGLTEEELIKKSQLLDDEIIQAILSEIKKRKESILLFEKGERQDLADKEKEEIKILQKYLPEQISEEELKKIVQDAVKKTGAASIKEMGKVMKEVMPKVKGRADGSKISQIVKELLSK